MRKDILGYLSGLGSAVLMGFSWYATKRIGQISGAHVFDILSVRYLISALAVLLLWKTGVIRLDYRGRDLRPLVGISLLMPVVYNVLEYSALNYIASAEIGMLCSLAPVAVSLMGYFVLKERITRTEGLFVAVAVAGVAFLNVFDFAPADSSNVGRLLMLGCVLCSSLAQIKAKKASAQFRPIEITAVMMWTSAIVLTVLAVGRHLAAGTLGEYVTFAADLRIYGYLLYLSIGCSLVGFSLGYVSVANLPVTRATVLSTSSTVVAVVSGAVLLKEPLLWYDYVGCAVIMIGVTGCSIANSQKKQEA